MVPLPLPEMSEITWVLEELFGRDIKSKECAPLPIAADTGAIVSLVDDARRVRAVWIFDIALANIVGTALTLAHPDKALRATNDGIINGDTRENIAEVVNVATSSINGEGRIHVKLGPATFVDDGSFGHDLWRSIKKQAKSAAGSEHSFELAISGYGTGRMTLKSFGFGESESQAA
jgi:hypothetical protein